MLEWLSYKSLLRQSQFIYIKVDEHHTETIHLFYLHNTPRLFSLGLLTPVSEQMVNAAALCITSTISLFCLVISKIVIMILSRNFFQIYTCYHILPLLLPSSPKTFVSYHLPLSNSSYRLHN
jgi:hypothetical protein